MNNDCGSPAFENVDDILTEKIIVHSVRHTGKERQSAGGVAQMSPDAQVTSFPLVRIIVIAISTLVAAALLATLITRVISPSSD